MEGSRKKIYELSFCDIKTLIINLTRNMFDIVIKLLKYRHEFEKSTLEFFFKFFFDFQNRRLFI